MPALQENRQRSNSSPLLLHSIHLATRYGSATAPCSGHVQIRTLILVCEVKRGAYGGSCLSCLNVPRGLTGVYPWSLDHLVRSCRVDLCLQVHGPWMAASPAAQSLVQGPCVCVCVCVCVCMPHAVSAWSRNYARRLNKLGFLQAHTCGQMCNTGMFFTRLQRSCSAIARTVFFCSTACSLRCSLGD